MSKKKNKIQSIVGPVMLAAHCPHCGNASFYIKEMKDGMSACHCAGCDEELKPEEGLNASPEFDYISALPSMAVAHMFGMFLTNGVAFGLDSKDGDTIVCLRPLYTENGSHEFRIRMDTAKLGYDSPFDFLERLLKQVLTKEDYAADAAIDGWSSVTTRMAYHTSDKLREAIEEAVAELDYAECVAFGSLSFACDVMGLSGDAYEHEGMTFIQHIERSGMVDFLEETLQEVIADIDDEG